MESETELIEGEIDGDKSVEEDSFRKEQSQSVVMPFVEVKSNKLSSTLVPTFLRVVKSLQPTRVVLSFSPSPSMSNEDVVGDISSDSSAIEEKAYIDESDENGENEEETGKSEDTDDIGDSQDENSDTSRNDDTDKNEVRDSDRTNNRLINIVDDITEGSNAISNSDTTINEETNSSYRHPEVRSSLSPLMSRLIRRRNRYGKRLGRESQLSPLMIELSRPNSTYYPPDHLNDAVISHLMKQIANKERKTLNRLSSSVRARGKEYSTMFHSIDIPSKQSKLPKPLQQEFHSKSRPGPEGVCEGCSVDESFPLRRTSKNKEILLLRKFVGNVETKDIELTGRRVPKKGTPMDVTAIMVTTWASGMHLMIRKTRLFFIKQLLYRWDG